MKRVLIAFLSISGLLSQVCSAGDEKSKTRFAPAAPDSYRGHETHEGISMAAVPYVTEEQTQAAFGKLNPNVHGVLPVLLILENKTGKALRLDLKTELEQVNGKHTENTPAKDLQYLRSPKPPKIVEESRLPIPIKKNKKSPFDVWEIDGRAFSAKLLPPGETVSGFFYFQGMLEPGSKLYLTGIRDAQSGKEFFYFELPLERQ